jgi:hypothetical protein
LTTTYKGFLPVSKLIISKACLTILMALAFLPVFLPWNCSDPTRRSMIGQSAFLNFLA